MPKLRFPVAARAMLYDQDMPEFPWAKACNTKIYVQNRTPHRVLGKITPKKVFTRKTHEVSNFSKNAKAYIVYLPGSRKVVVQWDVKFMEDRAFRECREMSSEEQSKDELLALVAQVGEPFSFQEAVQHQVWVDAMVEEYNSIMVNDVWEVVPRPQDRSVVGLRWIYKAKYAADNSVEKYKARFMAKGYAQKEAIDYEETFTPVARNTSIRTVISLAA
eukprot:PITA_27991